MKFEKGISLIREALERPLPGEVAQHIMAPRKRRTTGELLRESSSHRVSGVMLLLFPDITGLLSTVFIKRPESGHVHGGQIAFPGGKVEPVDAGPQYAALRETEEEIGVPAGEIEVIGSLSALFIPASNFLVHPFIGVINHMPLFHPNPEEVHEVITVNVLEILKFESTLREFQTTSGLLPAPCFEIQGHSIWGATAMMLSEFREMLKQ